MKSVRLILVSTTGMNSFAALGGSVVDHTLDYQSRDCRIDPPFLQSFG